MHICSHKAITCHWCICISVQRCSPAFTSKTKQKQSVRVALCTQSGPEKVVKQEYRQLHCCIRERSLSSPPQLTCRNRCLSYTPFGVGHFFLMYLIVIHFRNSSDVCTASNPSNNLHSNKSDPLCLTKPRELRPSVEKFLLWTYTAVKSKQERNTAWHGSKILPSVMCHVEKQ